MTKAEFVDAIRAGATKTQLTQAATGELVDLMFKTMAGAIRSDEGFRFPGFGTFTLRKRGARTGRHPQTGKAIKIKASKTVTFRPATGLKQEVSRPQRRKKASR